MSAIRALRRDWQQSLGALVSGARNGLVVAAPFMTTDAARFVVEQMHPAFRSRGRLRVLTDLSPGHVCDGSLQPEAVQTLLNAAETSQLWHIPCLHAKLYMADNLHAIVTSGNLTGGAFRRNVEYGVEITDTSLIATIAEDVEDFTELGAAVDAGQMAAYTEVATRVRENFQRQQLRIDPLLRQAFQEAVRRAEDELIRVRLAGGAMHTVFGKTILHVLRRRGPLPTTAIHGFIQSMHPDLCDDTVDRVIDGKSFGKKWKHAVRTAQQYLKKQGQVTFDGAVWRLTTSPAA